MIRRSEIIELPLMQLMGDVLKSFHPANKRLIINLSIRKSNSHGSPQPPPERTALL